MGARLGLRRGRAREQPPARGLRAELGTEHVPFDGGREPCPQDLADGEHVPGMMGLGLS